MRRIKETADSTTLYLSRRRLFVDWSMTPMAEYLWIEDGTSSFDHFVSAQEKRLGDREANRMRRLQIDNQLKCLWRLHREVIWRRTFEDLVCISSGLPENDDGVDSVR